MVEFYLIQRSFLVLILRNLHAPMLCTKSSTDFQIFERYRYVTDDILLD